MRSKIKLSDILVKKPSSILFFIFIFLLLGSTGCTPVKPWQKGNFAKRHMKIDPNPAETKFRRHVESSREGSSGGYGVGGGGCGCG